MKTTIGGGSAGKTTCLSASALKDFLACRRRFWFRYVENLVPLVRATPLSFGSAGHACMAVVLTSTTPPTKEQLTKIAMSEYTAEEIKTAGIDPLVAVEAVMAFDELSGWRGWNWKVKQTEVYFAVSMGRGKKLHGYLDGIAETQDNQSLIVENKFLGSITESYMNHLLWDDQASYYIVGARASGLDVCGILYNMIQKPTIDQFEATPDEKRKFTKDGKLYANQHDQAEPDADYLARVKAWYAENKETAFQTRMVMRNKQQVEEMHKRFQQIVTDLRHCDKHNHYYPNGDDCSGYFSCPYASICLEDTPEVRASNFTMKG